MGYVSVTRTYIPCVLTMLTTRKLKKKKEEELKKKPQPVAQTTLQHLITETNVSI